MKNRKQITKVCDNCSKCGLPVITCICNEIKEVETIAKFIILSSERELYRNTNTANLLKIINPKSTEIVIWERGKVPEEIIKYVANDMYKVYLVFPTINDDLKKRKVDYEISNSTSIFIIVDGTWKEAWKIIKKSDYLKELPILALETNTISKFILRRGQEDGNLCTIETTIELLKMNNEEEKGDFISDKFELFLESYKAGSSGHKII